MISLINIIGHMQVFAEETNDILGSIHYDFHEQCSPVWRHIAKISACLAE